MNPFSIKKMISTILLMALLLINIPSHYVFSSTNSVFPDIFIPGVSVPAVGLVAYYPFNNDYKDYSGSNNHGIAKGNIAFVSGKVGQAASFDGQSWVEVADSDSLDLINSFTFSLVVYKEDNGKGGYSVLLCKGDTYTIDNNAPYALFHTYDGLYPAIRLTKNNIYTDMFFTARAPDFKKWYHLAVTWDGRTVKLYLDGVPKDSKTWEGPLPSSTSKLLIGYDPTGWVEYFRGYMDEVRIYNRTLSQEEIISLYVTDIPGATMPVTVTPSPPTAAPPTSITLPVIPTQTTKPAQTSVPPNTPTLPTPTYISPSPSSTPGPTTTVAVMPPASGGGNDKGGGFLVIFFRIIGYLSIVVLMVSFIFMIKNLKRGRHLTIRSLVIPVFMSIIFLVVYSIILKVPGPTAISASLALLGLVVGVLWSRTTQLTVEGSAVYVRRSIWYVVIWGLTIIFTQFMVVTSTPELASYGLSTIYFSTGLAVSTNISLLIKHLQTPRQLKKKNFKICPRCQSRNEVGARVCRNCGQSLIPEKPKAVLVHVSPAIAIICPKCKTENISDSLYCENCGLKLLTNPYSDK